MRREGGREGVRREGGREGGREEGRKGAFIGSHTHNDLYSVIAENIPVSISASCRVLE